jgi:hypothetical protein
VKARRLEAMLSTTHKCHKFPAIQAGTARRTYRRREYIDVETLRLITLLIHPERRQSLITFTSEDLERDLLHQKGVWAEQLE